MKLHDPLFKSGSTTDTAQYTEVVFVTQTRKNNRINTYYATAKKSDILYAVSVVSRVLKKFRNGNWEQVKHSLIFERKH